MKIEKNFPNCRNKYITLIGDKLEADFMLSSRDWATPYISLHLNEFGKGGSIFLTVLCFSVMLSYYPNREY